MAEASDGLSFDVLPGAAITAVLDDLARLRIAVFRAYPYLYDGDEAYEAAQAQHRTWAAQDAGTRSRISLERWLEIHPPVGGSSNFVPYGQEV